jgi:hypothetical protein
MGPLNLNILCQSGFGSEIIRRPGFISEFLKNKDRPEDVTVNDR